MKAAERMIDRPEPAHMDPGGTATPRRGRPGSLAIAVIVAAVVGGGTVYLWDQDRGGGALQRAWHARDRALQQVEELTGEVEALQTDLTGSTDDVTRLRSEVERLRTRLTSVAGPALEDGRHLGYLAGVGATQEPPRLVLDLAEWFTDQEAVEAALEDGVARQDAGINGYYIRNENPRWRILEVAPNAPVVLTTYPIADPSNPRKVTLDRFGALFTSTGSLLELSPYWVTVEDGVVVAIEEQFVP